MKHKLILAGLVAVLMAVSIPGFTRTVIKQDVDPPVFTPRVVNVKITGRVVTELGGYPMFAVIRFGTANACDVIEPVSTNDLGYYEAIIPAMVSGSQRITFDGCVTVDDSTGCRSITGEKSMVIGTMANEMNFTWNFRIPEPIFTDREFGIKRK